MPVNDSHYEVSFQRYDLMSRASCFPGFVTKGNLLFKITVHEDQPEDFDTGKVRLFPNHTYFFDGSKYTEYLTVPVFVPDAPNPNIVLRPHYPKDLVYANNMDLSMEEIRAQRYLQR